MDRQRGRTVAETNGKRSFSSPLVGESRPIRLKEEVGDRLIVSKSLRFLPVQTKMPHSAVFKLKRFQQLFPKVSVFGARKNSGVVWTPGVHSANHRQASAMEASD